MSNEAENRTCPKCGAEISQDAPQGLCPKCLLEDAALTTDNSNAPREKPQPPSIDELNAAFPHLKVTEFVGQGGMGFVFKARQPKLERDVALKILPQSLAEDPAFAERFAREGRMLAKLNHPNIVTIYDFGEAGGYFYLLMEFVDGVNLRQAMRASQFTPEQALSIVPSVCEALQFAHDEGVLHRDIKPENILLDTKGRVKIADFGIAKFIEGRDALPRIQADPQVSPTTLTQVGSSLGTPQYMAPEQIERPGEVDHRADIYSLGVVFYELLTGELPSGDIAPPSSKTPVNPQVDEVVLRALEKERERRQPSATDFRTQVEYATHAGNTRRTIREETDVLPRWLLTRITFQTALISITVISIFFMAIFWKDGIHGVQASEGQGGFILFWAAIVTFIISVSTSILMRWYNPPSVADTLTKKKDKVASSNPWSRRVFWLLAAFAGTPAFTFMAMLFLPQAARQGVGKTEAALWLGCVAVVVAVAVALPIMALWSLRRHQSDTANPWPRRIVLMVCGVIVIPITLFISALVFPYLAMSSNDGFLPGLAGKARFGPVMERVLPEPAVDTAFLLDFETGTLLMPPEEVAVKWQRGTADFGEDSMRWLRQSGADAGVKMPNQGSLRLFEGVAVSFARNQSPPLRWDEFTPAEAVSALGQVRQERNQSLQTSDRNFYATPALSPVALAFITREGTMGVMEIAGPSSNPPGVKIRYKLLRSSESARTEAARRVVPDRIRQVVDGPYVAHLPRGGSIELLAVNLHPSNGQAWWQPNGATSQYDASVNVAAPENVKPGVMALARVEGPKTPQTWPHPVDEPQVTPVTIGGNAEGLRFAARDGLRFPIEEMGVFALADLFNEGGATTIPIKVAAGEWTTVQSVKLTSLSTLHSRLPGSAWQFSEWGDGSAKVAADEAFFDWRQFQYQLIAIDADGMAHKPSGTQIGIWDGGRLGGMQAEFRPGPGTGRQTPLNLESIREVRLESRPWETIEFRNVALSPGRSTVVTIKDFDTDVSGEPTGVASEPYRGTTDIDEFVALYSDANRRGDKAFVESMILREALNPGNRDAAIALLAPGRPQNIADVTVESVEQRLREQPDSFDHLPDDVEPRHIVFVEYLPEVGENYSINSTKYFPVVEKDGKLYISAFYSEELERAETGFGPVRERVVNDRSEKAGGDALQLSTGQILSIPARFRDIRMLNSWLEPAGADLVVDVAANDRFVISSRLTAVEVPNDRWNTATPASVLTALESEITGIGREVETGYGEYWITDNPTFPMTLVFKTHDEVRGILQITGITENPRGAKIRYKLLQSN